MRFTVVFETKHGPSETFVIEAESIVDIVTSNALRNDAWPILKIEMIEEYDGEDQNE